MKIHETVIPEVSDPEAVTRLLSDAHDRSGAAMTVIVHVMPFMDGDKRRYAPRIEIMADGEIPPTADWIIATLQHAAKRIQLSPKPDEARSVSGH